MDDFDVWNMQKREIDVTGLKAGSYMQEGDVWLAAIGKNIGYEQNGSGPYFVRPALIVKKFNNQLVWVVPLSTKQKNFHFYFNFTDPNGMYASAILSQLKPISTKRMETRLYKMTTETFLEIKKRLREYL